MITDDFDCSGLAKGASISLISSISDDSESMVGKGLLLIRGTDKIIGYSVLSASEGAQTDIRDGSELIAVCSNPDEFTVMLWTDG